MKRILSLLLVLTLVFSLPVQALGEQREYVIADTITGKLFSFTDVWSDLADGSERALYAACFLADAEAGLSAYGFRADEIHTIIMYSLSGLIVVEMYQGDDCWSFIYGTGIHVTLTPDSPRADDPVDFMISMYMAGVYDDGALISADFLAAAQAQLSTVLVDSSTQAQELFRSAESVGRYRSGYADFLLQQQAGFVSPDGVYLRDESWNYVYSFNECGYAVVYTGPFKYGYPSSEGKYGVINTSGELVVPMEYSGAAVTSDGYIFLEQDGLYRIFDSASEQVITLSGYDHISRYYSDGLFTVFIGETNEYGSPADGKYGCVTLEGEVVIPLEWDGLGTFWEGGMITCRRDGQYGVINRQGQLILPCEYKEVDVTPGYIAAQTETEILLFDDTGKLLHSQPLTPGCYAGLAGEGGYIYTNADYKTNRSTLWAPDGTAVLQGWYSYTILPGGTVRTGMRTADGSTVYALHDAATGAQLLPAVYSAIDYPYNSTDPEVILRVQKGELYGFIRTDGTAVTPVIYENATHMESGCAVVMLDGQWHFIDQSGAVIY